MNQLEALCFARDVLGEFLEAGGIGETEEAISKITNIINRYRRNMIKRKSPNYQMQLTKKKN